MKNWEYHFWYDKTKEFNLRFGTNYTVEQFAEKSQKEFNKVVDN